MSIDDKLLEKYAHIATDVDMLTGQARAVISSVQEVKGWGTLNA